MLGVFHGFEQGLERGLTVPEQGTSVAIGERLPAQSAEHLKFVGEPFAGGDGYGGCLLLEPVQQIGQGFVAKPSGFHVAAKPMPPEQHEHGHRQVGQADQGNDPGNGTLCCPIGQKNTVNTGKCAQVNGPDHQCNERQLVHHCAPSSAWWP